MTITLKNKRALITGAGAGLGRGIALSFAKAGADCAIWGLDNNDVIQTALLVNHLDQESHPAAFDLTDDNRLVEEWSLAEDALGGSIDILVHNAAVMPVSPIEELQSFQLDACFNVNLRAAVRLTQLATPKMKQKGGSILFMSSGTAHYGVAEHAVYCASKAGLLGLSRGLAIELAPYGIRVNTVSPGTIDSPMLDQYISSQVNKGVNEEHLRKAFDIMHPRGKIGSIEDVANAFLYLASDAASNITGADLRCDGGLSVKGAQASV